LKKNLLNAMCNIMCATNMRIFRN